MEKEEITIKNLLDSGAHFGHQKRNWNPKMRKFIFEERNNVCIINLAKTIQQIRIAIGIIEKAVEDNKLILFVGTKKQAKNLIQECAEECGEFYIKKRWLGGMLTNLSTIRKSIKTLDRIEKLINTGSETLTKKEKSVLNKKYEKLIEQLSGVRKMKKLPGLVIVVDSCREHIAVSESNKLGIPVIGLIDTNSNPDHIDHVIACNDDSLKSIKLILNSFCDAILEKKRKLNIEVTKDDSIFSSNITSKKEGKEENE